MNSNTIRICGLGVDEPELDEDGDGIIDSTQGERVMERIVPPNAGTEVTQTIDKMNRDAKDPHSNFSSIDFNSDLSEVQVNVYAWHDSLVEFRVSPKMALSLTRGLKRNAVSKNRGGRKEVTSMFTGNREHEKSTGFFGRVKDSIQNRNNPKDPGQYPGNN